MKAESRQSGQLRDNAGTTLTPSCANPPTPPLSATAGSAAPSNEMTSPGKLPLCKRAIPTPKSSPTSAAGSTSGEKGLLSLLERLHRGDKLIIVVAHRELRADKARCLRIGDDWHQAKFRSRKAPRQGCFIPASAITEFGAYHTVLGKLRMSERLPADCGDSRLSLHNSQYHLVVTMPAQRHVSETQARVVALDPGIRSFLTWFSETEAGHVAPGAFGRIQRLCTHLDNLLSKAKLEKRRLAKRNKYRAASRMRIRIINLVDELHHQAARWLADSFDVILLPTFETSGMTQRGARKLRSKSVRSLLTYAHYRFQRFLAWKAWQSGKDLLLVNEAYTSKTCSWSGEIIPNLGGRRVVAGSDGVRLNRDINGARGIFLRALGDTPALHEAAQGRIGNYAVSVS